jgi:hypothetical protein
MKERELTQKEKEEVIDSIDWVFWDVKKSISSCNRLLCLATDTSMELDQRDKDALRIIVDLQNALIDLT